MNDIEIAIIGAGPAGIAAGLQLKRYGLEPVIFEAERIGGLLHNANLVENYPGFPSGISGRAMVNKIKHHAEISGLHIKFERVESLDYQNSSYLITARDTYRSHCAIIASGTGPVNNGDIAFPDQIRERVLHEIAPILEIENTAIGIIGGGDAAFDYALNLGQRNKVTILNRGNRRKCLPLLFERAMSSPNITYLENARLNNVRQSGSGRIAAQLRRGDESHEIELDYLVFAIGRQANLDFLSDDLIKLKDALETDGTLHFIGDVANGPYRQVAIAAGDGIRAAMMIHERLKEDN